MHGAKVKNSHACLSVYTIWLTELPQSQLVWIFDMLLYDFFMNKIVSHIMYKVTFLHNISILSVHCVSLKEWPVMLMR
jgi:hypothetical protein